VIILLHGLFGNKNVARILLFLFVNESCYATQVQSLLQVPLTPLQRTLAKLEKEKILISHYEGKTRVYTFYPYYPLRTELETLLKKAYTLLPPQEKKRYCFVHKPRALFEKHIDQERTKKQALLLFWEHLKTRERLQVSAKSKQAKTSYFRSGEATVRISEPSKTILVFEEKGCWIEADYPETSFSNAFRWTLDNDRSLITLEHLRYGQQHPVFLFHLTPTQPHTLESIDAHLCGDDTYLGNIIWGPTYIDLHWRIIGPDKNDHLMYHYT